MDVLTKLTVAKANLVIKAPFFASLLLRLPLREDNNNCPTIGTNGKEIVYNYQFVERLPLYSLVVVFIHEIYHIILLHNLRRGSREGKKWNYAADYSVNYLIKKAGYKLLEEGLYNSKYDEMWTVEKIYDDLPDPPKDFESIGGVSDLKNETGGELSEAEKSQYEQELKISIKQALQTAKMAGKIPKGLEKYVEELLEPKINWKEVLNSFLTESVNADYTWSTPNKRYLYGGLYLPSLCSEKKGNGILGIDTSGSIGTKEMTIVASETQGMLKQCNLELLLIYCDAAVAGTQEVTSDDVPLKLNPKGGGGTNYRPVFEYVEDNMIDPAFLIYLTDGYCNSFPCKEPNYPVLWAVCSKTEFNPPFGEVLRIEF